MIKTIILTTTITFIICLGSGMFFIPFLRKLKYGQQVRDDGPQTHLKKTGTPTMGGIMMLFALVVGCAIFAGGDKWQYVMPALIVTLGFGLIGFLDDYIKVVKKRSLGLRAYQKIIGQLIVAIAFAVFAQSVMGTKIWIPFTGNYVDFGWAYIPFIVFVVVGVVNSVNLTDGLDGLASGVTLIVAVTYAIIFYHFADANVFPKDFMGGLLIFASAFIGALLGFLRFNVYPAVVFMGDTGSLALGGAVAYLAIMSNTVLLLPIIGGVFVASTVSVILQVGSFKLRHGKRIFKMAPLHHHFELLGLPETKVVSLYMITTVILCLIGLLAISM